MTPNPHRKRVQALLLDPAPGDPSCIPPRRDGARGAGLGSAPPPPLRLLRPPAEPRVEDWRQGATGGDAAVLQNAFAAAGEEPNGAGRDILRDRARRLAGAE